MKQINILPRHNISALSADNTMEVLERTAQVFPQTSQDVKLTLEEKYPSDAAIMQYALYRTQDMHRIPTVIRLKESSLAQLPSDITVQLDWVALDWDLPSKGVRWDDPSKPETKESVLHFITNHPMLKYAYAFYFSKSGVRILFKLANPFRIRTSEDRFVWNEFYREFVRKFDVSSIGGEIEERLDPFALSRVPNYVDNGQSVEGEIHYLNTEVGIRVTYPQKEEVLKSRTLVRKVTRTYDPLNADDVKRALIQDPLIQGLRNGCTVCYSDWRALGTNIVALLEPQEAYNVFREISSWDTNAFDPYSFDTQFSNMVESFENYGPVTWGRWSLDLSLVYGEDPHPQTSLAKQIRTVVENRQQDSRVGVQNPTQDNSQTVDGMLEKKTVMRGGQAHSTNKKTLTNLSIILTQDNRWKGMIRRNHLGQVDQLGNERISDEHITAMRETISRVYGLTFSKDEVWDFIKLIASRCEYNPVADYISQLRWDGVDRVEGLARSLGHSDEFTKTILKKFLISAVVRPIEWDNYAQSVNWKVDTVLILKGGQGKRKSSFFKALCSDEEWFSDNLPSITHERKDASLHMLGKWLVEQAEFEGHVARSSVEMMKAFITREREIFRKAYGRSEINQRRPSILVGTTNSSSFLNDPTGDRRFWVIEIPEEHTIDLQWVKLNRDQLWAQAREMYTQGEIWWLTDDETVLSNSRNSRFRRPEALHEAVLEFINSQPTMANLTKTEKYEDDEGFTMKQLVTIGLDKKLADIKSYESVSITSYLAKMGYVKVQARVNKTRMYVFRKIKNFQDLEYDY